eukprot:874200-Pyramimonas_sp.AAC.2
MVASLSENELPKLPDEFERETIILLTVQPLQPQKWRSDVTFSCASEPTHIHTSKPFVSPRSCHDSSQSANPMFRRTFLSSEGSTSRCGYLSRRAGR